MGTSTNKTKTMRPQFLRAAARSRSQHSPRHSCGRLGYNYGYSCAVAGRSRSFATTVPRTAEVELTIGALLSMGGGDGYIDMDMDMDWIWD